MSWFAATAGGIVLGLGVLSVTAHASVLYKCTAKDGSIAYVSSEKGYTGCKLLGHFADPAPVKSASARETHGWVYKENPKSATGREERADVNTDKVDVSATGSGVQSTAPVLKAVAQPAPKPAADAHGSSSRATMAAAPKILRGAVYRVAGKDNVTEYTNVKPAKGAFTVLFSYIATCFACDLHSKVDFARTALNLDAYKDVIAAAAADYGIDSALLHAVIHAESAFNPLAISAKGAQGLMQLMPSTAGDLGVTDAFDAVQNIRGGARYLAELLKDFNGNSQLATAAYNAGPAAVQKYGGVPPYDETRLYVQRVAELRDRYKKAL